MAQTQHEDFLAPKIVRCQVDSLSIFEITDYELEMLEQGAPNAICLNFSILFISIAFSFLITLLTLDIQSMYVFTTFVVFTVVGFSVGIVLLILWLKTRTKINVLVTKIKARVPTVRAEDKSAASPSQAGMTATEERSSS